MYINETLQRHCCVQRWQSLSPCAGLLRKIGLKVHSWPFAELHFGMDWNLTSLLGPDGPQEWKNTSDLSLGEFWEVEGERRLLLGKHLLYLCFSQGIPACPSSLSGPPLKLFTWVLGPFPACSGAGEMLADLQHVTPTSPPALCTHSQNPPDANFSSPGKRLHGVHCSWAVLDMGGAESAP